MSITFNIQELVNSHIKDSKNGILSSMEIFKANPRAKGIEVYPLGCTVRRKRKLKENESKYRTIWDAIKDKRISTSIEMTKIFVDGIYDDVYLDSSAFNSQLFHLLNTDYVSGRDVDGNVMINYFPYDFLRKKTELFYLGLDIDFISLVCVKDLREFLDKQKNHGADKNIVKLAELISNDDLIIINEYRHDVRFLRTVLRMLYTSGDIGSGRFALEFVTWRDIIKLKLSREFFAELVRFIWTNNKGNTFCYEKGKVYFDNGNESYCKNPEDKGIPYAKFYEKEGKFGFFVEYKAFPDDTKPMTIRYPLRDSTATREEVLVETKREMLNVMIMLAALYQGDK